MILRNKQPLIKFLAVFNLVSITPISSLSSMAFQSTTNIAIPTKLKGILFDIDGTLADSWKLGFDATQVVLKQNNIPEISEKCYHEHCIYATPERLGRHAGLIPDQDQSFEEVGNRLGNEFDNLYVDLVSKETAGFYPGIMTIIEELPSDIKLGALTNACVAYAHAVLKSNCDSDTRARFVTVNGADNVPAPKPNPDGILKCCEEMGLDPMECVYIGDSPSDGKAAHNAGMASIGVLWGSNSKEKLEEAPFLHLCSTTEELKLLLLNHV